MTTNKVEIIRHTHDSFEVVAYDLFGTVVRHRMYIRGRNRKSWAIQQASRWAEELYLWFDGKIHI